MVAWWRAVGGEAGRGWRLLRGAALHREGAILATVAMIAA